jgi:hypothetical protein
MEFCSSTFNLPDRGFVVLRGKPCDSHGIYAGNLRHLLPLARRDGQRLDRREWQFQQLENGVA